MDASQSSQHALSSGPSWTSIPLEKFSHSTTAQGAPPQYVHDNRKNELSQVFQPTRVPNGSNGFESHLIMSVIVGQDALERVNLNQLLRKANEIGNSQLPSQEPPVNVVVRSPCIAIRYLVSSTMVRRIQMRYKSSADYETVLRIFQVLNFPIKVSVEGLPKGPSSHGSSTNSIQQPHRMSGVSLPGQPQESLVTHRPENTTDILQQGRVLAAGNAVQRPHTASSGFEHTEHYKGSMLPGNAMGYGIYASERPATALGSSNYPTSLYVSQLSKQSGPVNSLGAVATSIGENVSTQSPYFTSASAAVNTHSDPLPNVFSEPFRTHSPRLDRGSLLQPPQFSTLGPDVPLPTIESTGVHFSAPYQSFRPMSAPIHANSQLPSNWVPPKRELPFPSIRSSSNPRAHDGSSSTLAPNTPSKGIPSGNDLESVKNPAALDHTTPIRATQKPIKRIAKRTPKQVAHVESKSTVDLTEPNIRKERIGRHDNWEEPSPLAAKSASLERPATAPGLPTKAVINRKRKADLVEEPDKQRPLMVDKATQTQTASGRDHTSAILLTTTGEKACPCGKDQSRPGSPPKTALNEIETFVSKYKNQPAPVEIWHTARYNEASAEERQLLINNFICDNLDNEEFLQLCEDTGNVWRRIGLEM